MRERRLYGRWIAPWVAAALLLTVGMPAARAAAGDDEELPLMLQQELEWVLQARASELLNAKNDQGLPYKRGTYSRNYHKVDDSTYQVTFHEDTASPGGMKTERYLLTLKKGADGKWAIAGQELQDTYDRLARRFMGDEKFYTFDTFSVEHEGMKVRSKGGSVYTDDLAGHVYAIVLTGQISYDYRPPEDADPNCGRLWSYFAETKADDFVFEPERVTITCSPKICEQIMSDAFTGLTPSSESAVDSTLRSAYGNLKDDIEKARKNDPFSGFDTPFEEDHRRYTIALKRKGAREHWLYLTDDSHEGWEVHLGATHWGRVIAHYSEDTRHSGVSPYELEKRADGFARDYDVRGVKGTIEAALHDPETMSGDVTFTLTTLRPLNEIPFRIARLRSSGDTKAQYKNPDLVINSIQDGDGNELTWVKVGSAAGLVVPPHKLEAGTEVKLRLQFDNKGAVYKLSPSYSRLARGGWLPFVNFGDMISHFDLTVKVPSKYETLGVGHKVSEETHDGVSISHWTSKFPVSFPTIIFGEYLDAKPSFEAKKSDGTIIPVIIHADKYGMQSWDIRPKQLPAIAEAAVNSINLYSKIYGMDYPFSKLDLVNDPMGSFYGQSPASIVYLGSGVFRGSGILGTAAGDQLTKFNDSVVAHEVGHQWWGSLIANLNMRNYWFVESLAEYSAAMFLEALRTNEGGPEKGWDAFQDHVAAWRHTVLDSNLWGSVQASDDVNSGARTAAIYNKGPYAFYMLRMTFGTEKMNAFLKMMAEDLEGKEIITRDIQHEAEKAFGGKMDWFFDQWIRGVGIPEYNVSYSTRRTEDQGYLVQGNIKQRVSIGHERKIIPDLYFRGVGTITVTGRKSGKEYPVRLLVDGPETPFQFKVPEEPLEIEFNKYGEILAQDVKVNESW